VRLSNQIGLMFLIGDKHQMTTTTKPTVKEAKQVIDNNFSRYMDGQFISPLSLDIIGYAVANEVQLRDYLLGYALESGDIKTAIGFVNHLLEQGIHEHNRHAFFTVLCALHLQDDNRELAVLALDEAKALEPTYSLTLLLNRVIGAGWPTPAFTAMTHELHPKVLVQLNEIAEQVIEIK
jgi:hypothetical protein